MGEILHPERDLQQVVQLGAQPGIGAAATLLVLQQQGGFLFLAQFQRVGQVFQLGLKYSKALDLKVLDQNGKAVPVWMGCYGIGVSRVLACIAETHHDEAGLAWPSVIAPAAVHVVATGKDAVAFEGAEKLVAELKEAGAEAEIK